MKKAKTWMRLVSLLIIVLLAFPMEVVAQGEGATPAPAFQKEELEQILSPIALYPDDVLAQILIASTYPLEIVEADRWVGQNGSLKGNELTSALEAQNWDPSVKSLVNFPKLLSMLSQKLDWTQKLGDAFLSQQQDVMQAVQSLRRKANAAGALQTTKEQTVVVEKETIIIQPADPQVVYVPTYDPLVVYGVWPYPAYPPYAYYPPGYVAAASAFSFAAGVAVGAAWGYAWGNCNWHGNTINYNINKNININNNINRRVYANQYQGSSGTWQHNPDHRQGVAYRDNATAQRYGGSGARSYDSQRSARGYGDAGAGWGGQANAGQGAGRRDAQQAGLNQANTSWGSHDRSGERSDAFSGFDSGSREVEAGERGLSSRSESFRGSASSFGGGGFSRGGFSRGGGRR